jgi:hypothetical protein
MNVGKVCMASTVESRDNAPPSFCMLALGKTGHGAYGGIVTFSGDNYY